ncbi:MAG: YIP1 family protein [Candidatus Latescibacteria bacterium]|nr:YIP1 family protein [Candidatus Latescibacterota bacterium]
MSDTPADDDRPAFEPEFPRDPGAFDGGDAPPPDSTAVDDNLPPWEDGARFSRLSGFFETIRKAMTAPGAFFTDHPVRRGLTGPVSFAVILGTLTSLIGWVWSKLFDRTLMDLLEQIDGFDPPSAAEAALTGFFETAGVLASPLLALIGLFIQAGIIHLAVLVLVRNGRGFEATLRACAYGGAAMILTLIPMCGNGVGSVWALVLTIIGIQRLHRCGGGTATLIVLLPLLLCCGACGGIAALIALLAAS